jgi:hypothetical protein
MPIEFRCTNCQRLLRTADDTAGKQTQCPECGTIVAIPGPLAVVPEAAAYGAPAVGPPGGAAASAGAASGSPFARSASTSPSDHPFASPAAGYGWRSLGEVPQIVRDYRPSVIDLGDVLSRSWRIYLDHFAECFLATLIDFAVAIAFGGIVAVLGLLGVAAVAGLAQANSEEAAMILAIFLGLMGVIGVAAFFAWLWAGYSILMLKISRGEDRSYGDLFHGGPFIGRMFWGYLLFTVLSVLAMLACFLPMILVSGLLTNFRWLVIDRNERLPESFGHSKDLALFDTTNLLTLVMIWFLRFGVNLVAGSVPVLGSISFLFTLPYFSVLQAVAYLRLTGQSTADMLPPSMSR